MKFSMIGQENGDLLIEVTTWTGLTVFVQTEFHECLTNRAHKTILCKKKYAFWYIMRMRGIASESIIHHCALSYFNMHLAI
jgi:hypothetical protein